MLHLRPHLAYHPWTQDTTRCATACTAYPPNRGMIMTSTESTVPHHSQLENELRGSWNTLTGKAQMLTGAQLDDPELFANGVINALQGQLQEAVGDHQAQVASDALRTQWSGLSKEAKGKILMQWGKWADDPDAMAQGVVDLMQGKLDRYAGAAMRESGTPVSDAAITLSDQDAATAKQALATLFAGRTT